MDCPFDGAVAVPVTMLRTIAFVGPLGFDTLAVAIALGLGGVKPWLPAAIFTVFETIMPIFGIFAGRLIGERFAEPAEILGGLVLIGVGVHAFREAMENEHESNRFSFVSLPAAAAAGVAISMDELAVGFPLGAARLPIVTVLLTIAVQTFLVTAGGILIGSSISSAFGKLASRYAHAIAGSAFAGVGIWLIVEAVTRG